jgi:hypothetical protein
MAETEKTRILNLLKEGTITTEEAEKLLDALESRENVKPEKEPVVIKDTRGRKSKKLHIMVDAPEKDRGKTKVNVNIPISLIKSLGPIAVSSIPKKTREELEEKGVDINSIISQVEELIDGNIEEDIINVGTGEDGDTAVRVYVE